MILIDSAFIHSIAFTLGTLLFVIFLLWAIWYAANMD